MTLRKSVGIGVTGIILLSTVTVLSLALLVFKLEDMGKREMHLIELNDHLNRGYFELIAWMSEINVHVFDDWPFEGNLDSSESLLGKWFKEHESMKSMSAENEKMVEGFAQNTRALFLSAAKIVKTGDIELKKEIYLDEFQSFANAIEPLVGGIANFYQAKLADIREERMKLQKEIGYFIIVASSITIIVMVFAALAIFRRVLKPLHYISGKMIAVGQGDLGVSVDYKANNEIGDIARNFNKMVRSFSNIINGILTSSSNVVSTVDVLREMAKKTAEGAQNQNNQTTQAATATEEMSQTITEIAQNASMAADSSSAAIDTADKGKEVADGAVETINQVYTSTVGLATEIDKLNKSVSEIGEIVTVINGIADQTNLLALNAAIEAARAGEQGRGFAVVADEVRKLAENTIKATANISEKIGVVQKESEQTARSMEESSGEVTKATEYIRNLGDSLESIVKSVQKVRDEVTQIATAVDQQSAATDQVTSGIEQTAVIAREVEKMSGDVLHEVNNLTHIAEELKNSSAGFKTDENGVDYAELSKESEHDASEQDSSSIA